MQNWPNSGAKLIFVASFCKFKKSVPTLTCPRHTLCRAVPDAENLSRWSWKWLVDYANSNNPMDDGAHYILSKMYICKSFEYSWATDSRAQSTKIVLYLVQFVQFMVTDVFQQFKFKAMPNNSDFFAFCVGTWSGSRIETMKDPMVIDGHWVWDQIG
jgi:hypothetical protein